MIKKYSGIIVRLALLIVMLIIVIVFKKESNGPETHNEKAPFIVGTAAGYAPFVSINAAGDYEGFDIDVAQTVADQLGKKLEIKDLGSMTSLFMALEQGSIDAIIWGLSITQDRLKKVAMIRYHGETVTEYPLLFWDHIPAEISSINDMANMTISVEPASAQEAALRNYPSIEKQYVDRIDDALLNIQYGKSDAALVEPAIARKFQKKYPNIKTMPLTLAPEDQVQGIGITLRKNDRDLIARVQSAVDALSQNGTLTTLETKWDIA